MNEFVLAHAAAADWGSVVERCIARLGALGSETNLGFVYVTDRLADDLEHILDALRQRTAIEHWVGSVGVGVCATGHEYMDEPAMAVLATALPANSFKVFAPLKQDASELSAVLANWQPGVRARFGIVHADPHNPRTPAIIEALAGQLQDGFVVGGVTSSRGRQLQIADGVTQGGTSGVLLSGDVAIATGLTQGCSPIGEPHRVTECNQNVLVAIDERPALQTFKADIGEVLARDLQRAAGYIFAARPIRGSDMADYTVRNIIGIDARNEVLAVGDVFEPGDPIIFCRRDSRTAREDMLRMLRDIKRRIEGSRPRGALYYTCLGRGEHMFGARSEELGLIARELGDIPLAGFFANGEISRDRLYGYTGVLTLFL